MYGGTVTGGHLARPALLMSLLPPPRGKKGTKAIPSRVQASKTAHVVAPGDMEVVLDGHHGGNRAGLDKVSGIYIADTQVTIRPSSRSAASTSKPFGE